MVFNTAVAEVTKDIYKALKGMLWKRAEDDDKVVLPGAAIGQADLQIIIGSGTNYESVESYNQNSVTRTVLVGVKKAKSNTLYLKLQIVFEAPQ